MTSTAIDRFDVVIVGAGVAGSSAAYHLQKANEDTKILIIDSAPSPGVGTSPRHAGSATMPSLPCVKMMVQIFAGKYDDFRRHHGPDGAARYLQATQEGLVLQKAIAREIWKENVGDHMKELGSYYLARDTMAKMELQAEYNQLSRIIGEDDIEWCSQERLKEVPGIPPEGQYKGGIYFPKDAIIDSSMYAKALLQYVIQQSKGNVQFRANSTLKDYKEEVDSVLLTLSDRKHFRASHVVMATGAFYQDPNLHGILKPCYSYLVNVPISTDNMCQDSPNFFTWGFTHDWCVSNGKVRISGEDHYSAYKPAKLLERCNWLSQWTLRQYGETLGDIHQNMDTASFPQQYGLYSETPDMAPLIGKLHDNSKICYLVGCNAWGQTILSYCASLVPGILGLKAPDDEQQEILKLVTIQRFSQMPAVVNGSVSAP